ncbi:MAG: ferrochelatase, partial [Alphaproteobacteria bacterium]|nr:ferrochelatase [Alphaproteobacteria bacterium]
VLMNLGGPDSLDAVQPFLFNLFSDPAIFRLPNPFRWLLAKLVSRKRAHEATQIYATLGGRSPIVPQTEAQAKALDEALADCGEFKSFIAMRYWHPMTAETVGKVKSWGADRVILLPLYPQFSTTTTASSIKAWREEAKRQGLTADTQAYCCYPEKSGFVKAYARLIEETLGKTTQPPRLLFSAHGLPENVVKQGDPYQYQVEQTVSAILKELQKEMEAVICYQSRVGPLTWIGPSTEEEIVRAGKEGKAVAIVPVAFVSEHSETLYELDIQYRELAQKSGVPEFTRIPAVTTHPLFIQALKELCLEKTDQEVTGAGGKRLCPERYGCCPCRIGA